MMITRMENLSAKPLCLLILFALLTLPLSGQNRTVGVFLNDSLALNGYTLFAPNGANETYLINNCGQVINTWTSNFRPGLSVYLLEDGSLIRPCRINSSFNAGGTAGRVEKYNWEGELLWGHNYSTDIVHQHHDVRPLPNGNILLLAWEKKNQEEAVMAGRNPSTIMGGEVWSEHLVEWKVDGDNPPEIVWEWHLWDHLIQSLDAGKDNFGVVSEHPERFDVNYINGNSADWLHCNAIDYNSDLDQIIINSRNWNEFWIIDHSTTTEEAASNTGGKYQKGGDILYRWGNPEAYDRGNPNDQKLFGQHNVTWIPKGFPGEGNILIFNNGVQRSNGNYSSVDEITPPINMDGSYFLEDGEAYGPSELAWTYPETPDFGFYASRISGAQRLSNGNTLICDGTDGTFFEVTPEGELVWEYVCPLIQGNPIVQGEPIGGNDAFRVTRYEEDYEAFANRDLEPGDLIELEPIEDNCKIYSDPMVSAIDLPLLEGIQLFPNPIEDFLQVQNDWNTKIRISIVDLTGRKRFEIETQENRVSIPTHDWPSGLYYARVSSLENQALIAESAWVLSKISLH